VCVVIRADGDQDATCTIQRGHPGHVVGDEDPLLRIDADIGRALEATPNAEQRTFGIEDLDSVILAVGDVYPVPRIDSNAVRDMELGPLSTRHAPAAQVPAVRRERVHARVAVAVCHVDRAVGRHSDIGGVVEGRLRRRLVARSKLSKQRALRVVDPHHMPVAVRDVDVPAWIGRDPVRIDNLALAQRTDPSAGRVEDHDRWLSSVADIHAAICARRDRRHRPEFHVSPARVHVIGELAPPNAQTGDRLHETTVRVALTEP